MAVKADIRKCRCQSQFQSVARLLHVSSLLLQFNCNVFTLLAQANDSRDILCLRPAAALGPDGCRHSGRADQSICINREDCDGSTVIRRVAEFRL